MAKYYVKMSCGHEVDIQLHGKVTERESRIEYLKKCGICQECKIKNKIGEYETVEMKYSEYKNKYPDYMTAPDSYDKKEKTIMVCIPIETIKGGVAYE